MRRLASILLLVAPALAIACVNVDYDTACSQDFTKCDGYEAGTGDSSNDARSDADTIGDSHDGGVDARDGGDSIADTDAADTADTRDAAPHDADAESGDAVDSAVDETDAADTADTLDETVGEVCVPLTSCPTGACGTIDDGCSTGTLDCGGCGTGLTCDSGSHTCVCAPITTCPTGACGSIDNGCGGTLDCGGCTVGFSCDTGSHTCVCAPITTCPAATCGTIDNGCGTSLDCGTCPSGQTCSASACLSGSGWFPMAAPPSGLIGRTDGSVVWTGTEMIIFGGLSSTGAVTDQGAAYNPATDSWRMLPSPPSGGRARHVAVWSGSQMFVWSGTDGTDEHNDGLIYDPSTNTWSTLPAAPIIKRVDSAGAWAPDTSEVIVWGGGSFFALVPADGAAYKPATGTWRTLAAPTSLTARSRHKMIYDGISMTIWGGIGVRDGARYYEVGDTWPSTISAAASTIDPQTTDVGYLSSRLIVWGGGPVSTATAAGAYFRAGAWTTLPTIDAVAVMAQPERAGAAHWDGNGKFWVWSGTATDGTNPSTGAFYDPSTNTWTAMSSAGAPAGRKRAYAVWTGTTAIVWGGVAGSTYVTDGGRYVP